MTRWTRLIPAMAVTFLLAACGQGTSDTPFSPSTPSFDGGGTTLGGNIVNPNDGTGGATASGTTSTDAAPADTTTKTGGTTLGGN
jgi:hypothetical protein